MENSVYSFIIYFFTFSLLTIMLQVYILQVFLKTILCLSFWIDLIFEKLFQKVNNLCCKNDHFSSRISLIWHLLEFLEQNILDLFLITRFYIHNSLQYFRFQFSKNFFFFYFVMITKVWHKENHEQIVSTFE